MCLCAPKRGAVCLVRSVQCSSYNERMKTLAIIGGGAAGLAAAISAALEHRNACAVGNAVEDLHVVVYEADERVGRSILATGNGRCNFTNSQIDASLYHNAEFVGQAFAALERGSFGCVLDGAGAVSASLGAAPANAVQAFFASLGLEWREEGEGRMYPYANKASSVLDVLRGAASALGVEECCDCEIASVEPPKTSGGRGSRFTLRLANGRFERADAVIVACGGRIARKMLPGGFAYVDPEAKLGPLATDDCLAKQLDNIRVRGIVRLVRDGEEVACETGEVLFRKYGLSGIAIFNLSRFADPGDEVWLDMLPNIGGEGVAGSFAQKLRSPRSASDDTFVPCDDESFARELRSSQPASGNALATSDYALQRYEKLAALNPSGLTCGNYLRGLVLPQVARVVLKSCGFDEDQLLARADTPVVIQAFKKLTFEVRGFADSKQCQVHRGGFKVEGFAPETMESREIPGLYATGEALDVDAPCGGFNLHWAWASGMLAGAHAAGALVGISFQPNEE